MTNPHALGGEPLRTSRRIYVMVGIAIVGIVVSVLYQFRLSHQAAVERLLAGVERLERLDEEVLEERESASLIVPTQEGNRWEDYLVALHALNELRNATPEDGGVLDRVLNVEIYAEDEPFVRLNASELPVLLSDERVQTIFARIQAGAEKDSASLSLASASAGPVDMQVLFGSIWLTDLVQSVCELWVEQGRVEEALNLTGALWQLACDLANAGDGMHFAAGGSVAWMSGYEVIFGAGGEPRLSEAERLQLDELLARLELCFPAYESIHPFQIQAVYSGLYLVGRGALEHLEQASGEELQELSREFTTPLRQIQDLDPQIREAFSSPVEARMLTLRRLQDLHIGAEMPVGSLLGATRSYCELELRHKMEIRTTRYANAMLIDSAARPEVEPPLKGRFEIWESDGAPHVHWAGTLRLEDPTEYTVHWSSENGYTDNGFED